jgi:hypothetical protein
MHPIIHVLIFAAKKSAAEATADAGKSLSLSWGLVIFGLLLGLAITLMPTKRTYEVKRPKDEK